MLKSVFTTMPMFVCGFWLILFLMRFQKLNQAKRMLTVFLLVSTLLYFSHCSFFNYAYSLIPFTDSFYQCETLWVYPLYLLYIKSLTNLKPIKIKDFLILLPGIIMAISSGVLYILMSTEDRNIFIMGSLYNNPGFVLGALPKAQKTLHLITSVIFALQLLPILFTGFKSIYAYQKQVDAYYSYTENKNLNSVKILLLLFLATSTISFIINFLGRSFFAGSMLLLIIPSSLFSMLLFILSYIGYRHEFSAIELKEMFQIPTESIPDTHFDDLKNRIVELMEKKQLFLQQDLKISDLSSILGTNRNYIYNTINVNMGISFSEFINRYRVEHAKQLLIGNPKLSVSEISSKSGFSSEVSFYRNFKLFVGTTPLQWSKKQLRAQDNTK